MDITWKQMFAPFSVLNTFKYCFPFFEKHITLVLSGILTIRGSNNLFKNCFNTFMTPFSITVCFFSFLPQKLIHEIQLSFPTDFCRACDSH